MRKAFLRFTRRKRCEKHIQLRQGSRVPLLDGQFGQLSDAGELIAKPRSRAGFASHVHHLKLRVRCAKAQHFAAAVARYPNNTDPNAHAAKDMPFAPRREGNSGAQADAA